MVRNKFFSLGVPVEVECEVSIRSVNVVPGVIPIWFDPNSVKTIAFKLPKKYPRQNVTSSVAEEDAVRKVPSTDRILLDARFQKVHALPA
jgi:hypothetical protein